MLRGFLIFLFLAAPAVAQVSDAPELRDRILAMQEADEREDPMIVEHRDAQRYGEMVRYVRRRDSVRVENGRQLDDILRSSGWPGISAVGEDGSAMAFDMLMNAYYADEDALVPTLRRALPLLRAAFARGEAPGKHYAIVFDILRLIDEGEQWYGTQVECVRESDRHGNVLRSGCEPATIEAEEAVDERRAELGLGTLEEHIREMESYL